MNKAARWIIGVVAGVIGVTIIVLIDIFLGVSSILLNFLIFLVIEGASYGIYFAIITRTPKRTVHDLMDELESDETAYTGEQTEENREPEEYEWRCPNCSRINQNFLGICDCGTKRPDDAAKSDEG